MSGRFSRRQKHNGNLESWNVVLERYALTTLAPRLRPIWLSTGTRISSLSDGVDLWALCPACSMGSSFDGCYLPQVTAFFLSNTIQLSFNLLVPFSLIIYLQLVMPSQFVLVETVNPELSPSGRWVLNSRFPDKTKRCTFTGQLPFLKNGDDVVAPFSSIIFYLADKGFSASPLQSSNALTAWLAHAESNLGDLVVSVC